MGSKVTYNQSGYIGCSMSENAARAYEDGERPASKWTKAAMIQAINRHAAELGLDPSPLYPLTKAELFDRFFDLTAFHHTGKYANETAFYDVWDFALRRELQPVTA